MKSIEQSPAIRFGWYLRPSYEMCRAQAEMHDLLKRQFGLLAAGAFMPHATIKGFFRSNASIEDIILAFDTAVEGHESFTVYNKGPMSYGRTSVVLNIHETEDGLVNTPLKALHESAWKAITPLVHPDCTFTPVEGSEDRFHAHLTLAMADLREEFYDEVFAFINEACPIGPDRFKAEYFHLFAFRSDAWDGPWWESLTWELLHSWKLGRRLVTSSALDNAREPGNRRL